MKQRMRLPFTFLFVVCLSLPAHAVDPAKMLQADLNRIFADSRLSDAQLGVAIYSLDRSEIVYEKNPSKLFMPASNNKIVTSAVALIRLGPDYRFKTNILADGLVADGALKGNLIVAGFGDPFSSTRFEPKDPFRAFREWAAKLKEQGIRAITGSIIGDGSAFEEKAYGQGWEWDDLSEGYAAPVSALQFNENLVWLDIAPGLKEGSIASIKMEPLSTYFAVENKVITNTGKIPAHIEVSRSQIRDSAVVSGSVSMGGAVVSRSIAVTFPVRYYLSALKQLLSEEGIDVSNCDIGESRGTRMQSASLLWTHSSPPLSELITAAMKLSLNLSNETLVRVLGLEIRGEGTFARGKEVVEETLDQMGIDKDSYSYADGSGLSRLNLVSPSALVRILKFMHQHPNSRYFFDALPIAGVDGTLAARMRRTKAEKNVHAKTGTYAHASALSGYVKTADGEMLAFSIIANNFLSSKDAAESVQDRALARLAGFSRKGKKAKPGE